MANQIQKVIYEGYLADDPQMRFTPSGVPVTNFRMGSSTQYKKQDGTAVKETTWLKVTAWNKLGEIVNKLCGKGSLVIVEGVLKAGETGSPVPYQMQSGEWGASYEIVAQNVRIIKPKEGAFATSNEEVADEDLPF